MRERDDVAAHYTGGNLLERLNAALRDDGVDPERPSMEALAPYDQFHGRGLEARGFSEGRIVPIEVLARKP